MSVKITDNTKNVERNITTRSNVFLRMFADDVERVSEPRTPKRLGFLRRSTIKQVLGLHGSIVWNKKYAAKQETTQFKNYTTPGTGPHYAEDAVRSVLKRTLEIARKAKLL